MQCDPSLLLRPCSLAALVSYIFRQHADQKPESNRKNHQVIQLAEYRNEVWNEIYWTKGVGDETTGQPFRRSRRLIVRENEFYESNLAKNSFHWSIIARWRPRGSSLFASPTRREVRWPKAWRVVSSVRA